ncbi:hypothetical protein J7E91_15770 [Streptomyces sp. ISL-99]|uniref:DUF6907 domain-containing protein n=1 Tax=Streptomyces sp. ISL-99 TaxID=2819193 RepID=UPI001BED0B39|nr:hypothetical protein [Streptomyces sp. ISL-99]MBT2526844.1 hypothetical protein [Streptomyces sp. ISL-99]
MAITPIHHSGATTNLTTIPSQLASGSGESLKSSRLSATECVSGSVADDAQQHADDDAQYLPELVRECERLGFDLQLTNDPAVDLPEIKVINGRRAVIARADEIGVARDDVRPIGRCFECDSELDDTAVLHFPADALLSFQACKDMTGADIRTCRPCVEASRLPLTAAQRGPEWMLRYGCTPWCVNDHAEPVAAEWHSALPVETRLRDAAVDSSGYGANGDSLPWLSAQVVVTNDKPHAYGRRTQVWLGYGVHMGELTPAEAREALEAMRGFVRRLEHVVKQAEEIARDDFDGDPEIARLDREAEDRRIRAIATARNGAA